MSEMILWARGNPMIIFLFFFIVVSAWLIMNYLQTVSKIQKIYSEENRLLERRDTAESFQPLDEEQGRDDKTNEA